MMRIAIFSVALVVTVGCHSTRSRQPVAPGFVQPGAPAPVAQGFVPPGTPAPAFPGAASGAPAPFPTVPQGGVPQGGIPPGAVSPGVAPANNFAPPGTTPFPTVPQVPTPAPPGAAAGKIEANWQPTDARSPAEPRVLLSPPEPVTGETKDQQKRLYPPQVEAGKGANLPASALPVGIPQFAHVKPNIAAGLRPALDGGLDWLQANKYRSVVHLRLPGENDDADRKQAQQRGLTYHSLEVSPLLLTKDTVDEFFKLVRDPMQQPVFVYDRDGALAGGLWYLWFRLVEEAPDDAARIRARALGLREDREGAHRDMWQSAQKYVKETHMP